MIDFEGSDEVLYVTSIFDLHIFDNEMTALLKYFEICPKIHFVSLFFLAYEAWI